MILLSLAAVAAVVLLVGRVLVGTLGWPTSRSAAARWCWALLAVAVLFAGLPEVLHLFAKAIPPVPVVSVLELVPVLAVLGLAALGYVGWARASELRAERDRRDAQASTQLRRRALPPAPAEPRMLPHQAEARVHAAEPVFAPRGRLGRLPDGGMPDA